MGLKLWYDDESTKTNKKEPVPQMIPTCDPRMDNR